ncbi:hypothetical protein NQ317_005593 [Molorchus minor]|uniref:Uncharacterized protein n=1 Tax=Molorchus minor TaxID=1323400 RepID=A0ABQ9K913_9CUCU|nr:hypothetical protein NQ317_005593 [Molorchus minor]
MGAVTSKSPLERRNTVARRSQRRSIYSTKSKIDKLFSDIKRFKGIEEDEHYQAVRNELTHFKNDLLRKSKELQPQLRNLQDTTLKRIDEGLAALEERLKENQEKTRRKEQENEEKARKKELENQEKAEKKKKDKKKTDDSDVVSENNDVEIKEIEEGADEATNLEQSTEKRKTVELKFVQIVPDEVVQVDVHENNNNAKSPEEKRKSILKLGVPVMPGAILNRMSSKFASFTKQKEVTISENDNDKIIAKVNEIVESLQAVEYQIADFVGKRHGTQYNRIRDRLTKHADELKRFNTTDDYALEQINICKNYVESCVSFLNEKSIDDTLQDDVFFPSNANSHSINSPKSISPAPGNNLSPLEARSKFQRISKTSAV